MTMPDINNDLSSAHGAGPGDQAGTPTVTDAKETDNSKNSDGQGSDSGKQQKTYEQIDAERKAAITEAIKNNQDAEKARADASSSEALLEKTIRANPDTILTIAETDPAVADRMAKKIWNMDFNTLVETAREQQNGGKKDSQPGMTAHEVKQAVREELSKEKQTEEAAKVQDFAVNFLFDQGLDPNSQQFKAILKDFKEFAPTSVTQAERLIKMSYTQHTGNTASDTRQDVGGGMGMPVSSGSRPSGRSSSKLSADLRDVGRMMGISDADFKKYEKQL